MRYGSPVNRTLLLLGLGLAVAATTGARNAPTPSTTPSAPAVHRERPAVNTHGLDMRTQSGPPGPHKYSPPFPVNPKLPDFWIIGDSTVRNGSAGNGTNHGQWGWGAPLTFFFNPQKVNVVNRALGGTSARSFYNVYWKWMVGLIKPGDVVIMQFGTNDSHPLATGVGDLRGVGTATSTVIDMHTHQPVIVHTFGWYLRHLVASAKAHGATPIVCSMIPHKRWDAAGHIRTDQSTYAGWAEQVAKEEHVDFINLNRLIARHLDTLSRSVVERLFVPPPSPANPIGQTTHTGWDGAVMNARIVVSGLKALKDDPVAKWFSARAEAVKPAGEN